MRGARLPISSPPTSAEISKVIEPISVGEKLGRRDSYPLFAQVCDWAHQQGGSDFPFRADLLAPWYPNFGLDRTYVPLGTRREFTYDAYIQGIRRGRTFATNGPTPPPWPTMYA